MPDVRDSSILNRLGWRSLRVPLDCTVQVYCLFPTAHSLHLTAQKHIWLRVFILIVFCFRIKNEVCYYYMQNPRWYDISCVPHACVRECVCVCVLHVRAHISTSSSLTDSNPAWQTSVFPPKTKQTIRYLACLLNPHTSHPFGSGQFEGHCAELELHTLVSLQHPLDSCHAWCHLAVQLYVRPSLY